jgi:hypothetical protein
MRALGELGLRITGSALAVNVWRDRCAGHAAQGRRATGRTDGPGIQEGICGMDVITQIRLLWLGGLGVLYGVALGTVWLLDGWQHRRELRRSQLLESVRQQFPVELRDQIAMQIRGTMFGRRAVITVDRDTMPLRPGGRS